jgi:anti-anti-sigma factor
MVSTLSVAANPVHDRTVVWLEGEHDLATTSELAETLAKAISVTDGDVVIDLSAVTFLSLATINELLRGKSFLEHRYRTLTLRSPSSCAERLLGVCNLTDWVER